MSKLDPETLIIQGASITDEIHVLDKAICGVSLCWNITRLNRDATERKFGPAIKRSEGALPRMTPEERANIDWEKVRLFVRRPDVLALPCITIRHAVTPTWLVHRIVDGNHRITARQLLGLPDYETYMVDETAELNYRVTFNDASGKEIEL